MSDAEKTPSELLEKAGEHEDRAESLRTEARHLIEEQVHDQIDFVANIDVQYYGDGFRVVVSSESLNEITIADDDMAVAVEPATLQIGSTEIDADDVDDIKDVVEKLAEIYENDPGAPIDDVIKNSSAIDLDGSQAEKRLEKLRTTGEIYEPKAGYLRTT